MAQQFEKLSRLDPRRIYVEEVRSLLGTNRVLASLVCQIAARQGLFEKKIGLMSPAIYGERILISFLEGEAPPDEIIDDVAQAMGEERYVFSPSECRRIEFYSLVEAEGGASATS